MTTSSSGNVPSKLLSASYFVFFSVPNPAQSESPYKGGTYHFRVTLPTEFPFKAPSVCSSLVSESIAVHKNLFVQGHVYDQSLSSGHKRRRSDMCTHSSRGCTDVHCDLDPERQSWLMTIDRQWKPAVKMSTGVFLI